MTTWVLDLDGVMWRGDTSIPGSADAVAALDAAGHTVAFCTNNSSQRIGFYIEKLIRFGVVETIASRTVSSATAAGTLIEAGERVLLCAGEGAREAVEDAGGELVDDPRAAERVIVGFHRSFDYDAMLGATRAVLAGATLLATNDDPIYPAADGPAPGGGAILASIVAATSQAPTVAGKPHEPMAALIRARFTDSTGSGGSMAPEAPSAGVFVGDSPRTDGAMAARLGWPFAMVLSGNHTHSDEAWQAPNLADLVEGYLHGSERFGG